MSKSKRRFQKVNVITVVLLFALILAGGVVRSTGSGMGCPDWPKCFGRYIPPTDVAELPKDYKQAYIDGRLRKNIRFAKTLDVFGYSDLAKRIREDRSILMPEEFNVAKTWTEYINRLIGAVSGIFLLLAAVFSFSYWTNNRWITIWSIFNLLLVGFQAWLGSIVVSTNLVAWIVTAHMLIALAILAISIYTYHASKVIGRGKLKLKPLILVLGVALLAVTVLQIVFGTEVRESIDEISSRLQGQYRNDWVKNVGAIFSNHRDMALVALIGNVLLYALIRRNFGRHSIQQQVMSFTFLVVMLQIGAGIMLAYWALPPFAQASHILLASLLFGAQFYLLLNFYKSVNNVEVRK
jgi:cytochrome c oxidase assembly protein subunit 15